MKFTQSSRRRDAHFIALCNVPVWLSGLSKTVAVVSERRYFLAVPVRMYARDECSKIGIPESVGSFQQLFGLMEQEVKRNPKKKKDYGLEKPKDDLSVTAKILNVNKRGNYKIYITLDNDQVWRSVKDIYDRAPVSNGQTVTISEGFISGYVMKVAGKKTSLRVKRVK